jgi:hypothetical protein
MMTDLEDLPASIIAHICRFAHSEDLIQLRAASTKLLAFLLTSEEANVIWRNALAQDFEFEFSPSTSSNTNASENSRYHLQTLGIHPQWKERHASSQIRTSIFGYEFSEEGSVFTATSAFESWKHWSKARAIHYTNSGDDGDGIDDDNDDDNDNDNDDIEDIVYEAMQEKINGPYFLRAANVWRIIDQWCRSDESGMFGDRLLDTFEPGVRRSQGRFPKHSNSKVVHAFEAIFAFCDGQSDLVNKEEGFVKLALFGGYQVYDHDNYTRLCATGDAKFFLSTMPSTYNRVAISCNYNPRLMRWIDLDTQTGALNLSYMEGRELNYSPAYSYSGNTRYDLGLLWIEEYARRLENRHVQTSTTHLIRGDDGIPFGVLSSFPSAQSPSASRKVTRGIEVVASSVGAVEIMTVAYSIRIRILTEGEDGYMTPGERGFDTCQLQSRHWKFHDDMSDSVDQVSGEGVVGLYPLLREGGYRDDSQNRQGAIERGGEKTGIFQYQSCASIISGTFQGQIGFVPGSLDKPTGDDFFVDLGKLTLRLIQDISY